MTAPTKEKLTEFRRKRDFRKTPEPKGSGNAPPSAKKPEGPVFVIQKHDATTLHYDFRLEVDGVLVSWAVPKGPPEEASQRRLAIKVEDHPLEYGAFEGTIPQGEYGGGTVMLWDIGTYENLREAKEGGGAASMAESVAAGLVEIRMHGERLKGELALKRFKEEHGKEQWLILRMKVGDPNEQPGLLEDNPRSVKSGRTMQQIARAGGGSA